MNPDLIRSQLAIKRAKAHHEGTSLTEIIVAFSTGKDALAVLDICARRFQRIEVYFMYWVRGLDFQERTLECAERRYGIKIYRVPHFEIPRLMGNSLLSYYRPSAGEIRTTKMREIEDHVRRYFNLKWIASGEKKIDTMARRYLLSVSGEWDARRLHYFPIMDWTDSQVWHYHRLHKIPTPVDYACLDHSWQGFLGPDLEKIAKSFPADYKKILEVFPFAEAIRKRYVLYAEKDKPKRSPARRAPKKRTAEVRDSDDQSGDAVGSAVQPSTDRRGSKEETPA